VLCTGSRSEKYAMRHFGHLPPLAFVEMGIFTGDALRACVRAGVRRVAVCGMVGKFAKLAQGHMQTHVAGNQVDTAFLAAIGAECGAGAALQAAIQGANTARHVGELVEAGGLAAPFYGKLAALGRDRCSGHVRGGLQVEALLFDFAGQLLGHAGAVNA